MKLCLLVPSRCWVAARGLLFGLALLAADSARAQNFVRNPDFEEPLGPDNWTVEYTGVFGSAYKNEPTNSGPNDFLVKGRTCIAHRDLGKITGDGTWDGGWSWNGSTNYWNKYGGHFQPNHTWLMAAYFKQVVTNLTPGSNYTVSAWMGYFDAGDTNQGALQIFLEALGGPDGTVSRVTPYVTLNVRNNPGNWRSYAVNNTASTNGQIEVRLHCKKVKTGSAWNHRQISAFYDHVAVVPAGQIAYLPPYDIVSLARTNQDISLTWETVMNNRYRLQCSKDLSSWSWVLRSPTLDTNFFATGTTFTFKTNLSSLFGYDPSFDPTAPLFFRVYSTSFSVP